MDRENIQKLANLARLEIQEDALDEVASSITNVLAFVDQLQAADTSGVTPLAHPLDVSQVLREDTVSEPDNREALLNIAPSTENGLFLVPKVIE